MKQLICGISCYFHDSSVCISDGSRILFAAQEERYSRVKNDKSFPKLALESAFKQLKITAKDVTIVGYYEVPIKKNFRTLVSPFIRLPLNKTQWKVYAQRLKNILLGNKDIGSRLRSDLCAIGFTDTVRIIYAGHHESHALTTISTSGWNNCHALVIDAVGEFATATLWYYNDSKLSRLETLRLPNSLGLLYSAITQFCGFKVDSGEYKLMGLSPYGKSLFLDKIHALCRGSDIFNLKIDLKFFDFFYGNKMFTKELNTLFGVAPRIPESELDEVYTHIAASLQEYTSGIILNTVRRLVRRYKIDKLCLSGGVALNCVSNGNLSRELRDVEISIFPHPGDGGSCVGAAVKATQRLSGNISLLEFEKKESQSACLGSSYPEEETEQLLKELKVNYSKYDYPLLCNVIADNLLQDKVIGIHNGRSEFGPRALGNRSIIALAKSPDNQRRVNLKIKYRESFRPFAPVMLKKYAIEYFGVKDPSKNAFMQYVELLEDCYRIGKKPKEGSSVYEIINECRSIYPSVIHVDFSARVQTVDSKSLLGAVLELLQKRDHHMLINTSFNRRGEPIVESPIDALRCLASTDIDMLIISNLVIDKKDNSTCLSLLANTITTTD